MNTQKSLTDLKTTFRPRPLLAYLFLFFIIIDIFKALKILIAEYNGF